MSKNIYARENMHAYMDSCILVLWSINFCPGRL